MSKDKIYYEKYLKYKNKYLNIKNNNKIGGYPGGTDEKSDDKGGIFAELPPHIVREITATADENPTETLANLSAVNKPTYANLAKTME